MRPAFLQWRYLVSAIRMWRHHRLQAFLSVLGVVAGVGGLITVLAVGNGAREELQRAIGLLGAGTLVVKSITESGEDAQISMDRAVAVQRLMGRELRSLVPVKTAKRTVLAGDNYKDGIKVIGTDRDYESAFRLRLHRGRFISSLDNQRRERVCVLGWTLARELFPQGQPVGQEVRIGRDWYTVVGWLAEDVSPSLDLAGFEMPEVDRIVYTPVSTLAGSYSQPPLDELVLNFANETDLIRASGAVQRILEYDAVNAAFEYTMPIDLLRQKMRMQRVIQYLLAGVTALMLLVGGVGIMNVMLVSVARRRPEIGLRLAVGATRRDIMLQFVTESTLVSMAGGLAGIALGFIVSRIIAAAVGWPVSFGFGAAVSGLVVAAVVGIGFGTYPARQAASVTPIKTLNQV